ncbi:MAG TPA: glutaredoxin family protein, partial [Candidatus Kapabacteria bacterium]|nr:glutaredoxin family protein [Candidatus Kapabacteria bacterium]
WIGIASVIGGAALLIRKKNTAVVHLQLLSKDDCSLCDKMKAVLDPEREALGFSYEEIKIHEGDRYWDEYWEKIPVLLADGKLIAKYSITKEELAVRIASLRSQAESQPEANASN